MLIMLSSQSSYRVLFPYNWLKVKGVVETEKLCLKSHNLSVIGVKHSWKKGKLLYGSILPVFKMFSKELDSWCGVLKCFKQFHTIA